MGCANWRDPVSGEITGSIKFGGHVTTCWFCGCVATLLCDHPADPGTCDKDLCSFCAVVIDQTTHYCPDHDGQEQMNLL